MDWSTISPPILKKELELTSPLKTNKPSTKLRTPPITKPYNEVVAKELIAEKESIAENKKEELRQTVVPHASEAFQQSKKIKQKQDKENFDANRLLFSTSINQAIEKGKFETTVYANTMDLTLVELLRNAGYKVVITEMTASLFTNQLSPLYDAGFSNRYVFHISWNHL